MVAFPVIVHWFIKLNGSSREELQLTNNNNKYWKHAEKMENPEIPMLSHRQIVITIYN